MTDDILDDGAESAPTEDEKRANVVRLVFDGSEERFRQFCAKLESAIPPGTGAVLRGSAVTGRRWKDGAEFDADGPGTSDMDVTLVGPDAVALFDLTGFFVPGIHSRPLSDDDPEIAPALIPLRQELMELVRRPVNLQASREIVIAFRGDLLGQPYLTLIEKTDAP